MSSVSSLIDSKKVKKVETTDFRLEGYLLKWKDVMIQVNNVSMITASDLPVPPFPFWSLGGPAFGILLGMFGQSIYEDGIVTLGICVGIVSVGFLLYWIYEATSAQEHKCLNIFMNSGYTYSIVFKNNEFLGEVLSLLEKIFISEIDERTNYYFNIQECKIENGSLVNRGTFYNNRR